MPLFDVKVSFYLSDHTEPGHASTLVIPGSHRVTPFFDCPMPLRGHALPRRCLFL